MSLSPKTILARATGFARRTAAGEPVPAGQDPDARDERRPSVHERASMRRRARRLRRVREAQLRDLGLLVVELNRRRRDNPELLRRKTLALRAIDDELRGLATALRERRTIEQVTVAGIAGSCPRCGTLVATDDRFCSNCGLGRSGASSAPPAAPASQPPDLAASKSS